MVTTSGQQNSTLAKIRYNEKKFDFFQAVRLVTRAYYCEATNANTTLTDEDIIRFRLKTETKFPVSLIDKIQIPASNAFAEMLVTFMGLTGTCGILPQHYTEQLMNANAEGNFALQDFFDIFNHRILTLLYKSWKKNQLLIGYEQARDEQNYDVLTEGLFSFSGIGIKPLQNRLSIDDEFCARYAGIFSRQVRSAETLESLLRCYFELPIKIIQFQGQWLQLQPADRSSIGSSKNKNGYQSLGVNFILGTRCWSVQNKFRLYLGPLNLATFYQFLPSGQLLKSLCEITRFYCGVEFDFDIQIELLGTEVPPFVLGENSKMYLGWNTWLKSKAFVDNPNDVVMHSQMIL